MFASSPRISQKRDRRQSIAYNLTDPVTRVYIAAPSDANGGHCRLVGRHRDSGGYSSACLSGRGDYATSAIANWERHGETLIEKARFNLQLAQMRVTTRDNWIIVGFRVSIESICESGHGRWPGRAWRARSRLRLRNHSHTLDEICWYHWWFDADKMRASVFDAAVEKRANLSLVDDIGHLRRCLFVTDKSTNFDRSWAMHLLEEDDLPADYIKDWRMNCQRHESLIYTYGTETIILNLGWQSFVWRFVIANTAYHWIF